MSDEHGKGPRYVADGYDVFLCTSGDVVPSEDEFNIIGDMCTAESCEDAAMIAAALNRIADAADPSMMELHGAELAAKDAEIKWMREFTARVIDGFEDWHRPRSSHVSMILARASYGDEDWMEIAALLPDDDCDDALAEIERRIALLALTTESEATDED